MTENYFDQSWIKFIDRCNTLNSDQEKEDFLRLFSYMVFAMNEDFLYNETYLTDFIAKFNEYLSLLKIRRDIALKIEKKISRFLKSKTLKTKSCKNAFVFEIIIDQFYKIKPYKCNLVHNICKDSLGLKNLKNNYVYIEIKYLNSTEYLKIKLSKDKNTAHIKAANEIIVMLKEIIKR